MKKSMLVISFFLLSCGVRPRDPLVVICKKANFSGIVHNVSFNDIDRIKDFDGQFVEIEGFFTYDFEDVALYSVKGSRRPGLWLEFTFADSNLEKLKYKYVKVIGKVNFALKGHDLGYLATLDSAFYISEVQ